MTSSDAKRVVIIGAGLTGIAALRRLSESKNFQLTCFERNYGLGGVWLYSDQTMTDDFGRPIHSAMYNYLKTNIPKQLMEIEGFPLDDHPSFPDRRQILQYLNKVADQCDVRKYIKFNMEISAVKPVSPDARNTKWLVTYGDIRKKNDSHTEEFDAVVVCSGNCTNSNYPKIEGEKDFQGLVMHSIRYRRPELFAGQTVAILGAKYSGIDISFELSKYAKKVFLCHRNPDLGTRLPDNIVQKTSGFKRFTPSTVILESGEELPIDAAIYCTGFQYNFPFLPNGLLKVGPNNLVSNLYKYILPAKYSTLFFMGITREVAFFPSSDHQALFVRAALEGSAKLPTEAEMLKIIDHESNRTVCGDNQWDWDKELSDIACNFKPLPPVLKKIWDYHFDIWAKDFAKCRSLSYKSTSQDSFVLM